MIIFLYMMDRDLIPRIVQWYNLELLHTEADFKSFNFLVNLSFTYFLFLKF